MIQYLLIDRVRTVPFLREQRLHNHEYSSDDPIQRHGGRSGERKDGHHDRRQIADKSKLLLLRGIGTDLGYFILNEIVLKRLKLRLKDIHLLLHSMLVAILSHHERQQDKPDQQRDQNQRQTVVPVEKRGEALN